MKTLNNQIKTQNSGIRRFFKRYGEDYLFMLPFLVVFLTFTVIPVFVSIVLSLTRFDVVQSPVFIGFSNYIRLLMDDQLFIIALKNTLLISLITGPLGFFLCILLAWLLNEVGNRTRSILTLLFYAPAISGGAYMIFQILFSADSYGFLNGFLINAGLISTPINWLGDTEYMMPTAIILILWMSFGSGFLSLIAGFKNMDRRLYEAAAIDGVKNRYQEMWYITLPSMKPQLMFASVMSITGSFGVGDVLSAVFGFPSANYAVYTLAHMLNDYGNTRFEMGYASAIATILFIIMVCANAVVQRLLSKIGD